MADLIREFPCFSGFVILALLGLAFFVVGVVENVMLARVKVRGIVEASKAEKSKTERP